MCVHGGERMVKVWVLDDKVKKHLHISQLMVMNLRPIQYASFTGVIGMDIYAYRTVKKDKSCDIKIRARSIGL